MEHPMEKLNDLSRSLSPFEPDGTLIAVIEMSLMSWLVAGIVPGVERLPLKKLGIDKGALLKLLHWWREEHRWREEAEKAGHRIKRIAVAFEAGRDGFWLARWLTRFITQKLKLKFNEAMSAVARPQERKFLGFSFTHGPEVKRVIAPTALERFKQRVREITQRAKGVAIETTIDELASYMRGWRGYFGFCETPEVLSSLTGWIRRRLRSALWRQWKTPCRRRAALIARGVSPRIASNIAGSGHGPWYLARSRPVSVALSNAHFHSLGLPPLVAAR
jgi:RNA-directed DNA polymerase